MESKYTQGVVRNVFMGLNSDECLGVLGLCLASNDLISNLEATRLIPDGENSYFFYNSIAIVREIAKLVANIEDSTLSRRFSEDTCTSFQELVTVLVPYHDTSLSRSVLKPIRDVTFHYDFTQSTEGDGWASILDELTRSKELDVGLIPNERSPLGQRYSFADTIRTHYVNRHLTKEIVSKISAVSVGIGVFVDSLLTDLVQELEPQGAGCGENLP